MMESIPEPEPFRAGHFLFAGDRYRLPERLQKKIDRFAQLIIRAGEQECP